MKLRVPHRAAIALCILAVVSGNTAFADDAGGSEAEKSHAIESVTPAGPPGNDASDPEPTKPARPNYADDLANQVQEAIDTCRRRYLSTNTHTPWQMMHGLLAYRRSYELDDDASKINALDWIADSRSFNGDPWFETTEFGGRFHPYNEPYAFEGHVNQFLGILAILGLPRDYEFRTHLGEIVTIADMLENAQKEVTEYEEIAWTLWSLSRYLPPDAEWTNKYGQHWSIERLVQVQTRGKVDGAPCGGTHGLFALAHSRNLYLRAGGKLRGVWLEADYKVRRYIHVARQQQNSNGTLSTNYFRGRAYDRDFSRRLASSGHILEFLMMAVPQRQLSERWIRRAVRATATDLVTHKDEAARCGPLYHAVHALVIYMERIHPAEMATQLARRKPVVPPRESVASRVDDLPDEDLPDEHSPDDSLPAIRPGISQAEPNVAVAAAGDVDSMEDGAGPSDEPIPLVQNPAATGPENTVGIATLSDSPAAGPAAKGIVPDATDRGSEPKEADRSRESVARTFGDEAEVAAGDDAVRERRAIPVILALPGEEAKTSSAQDKNRPPKRIAEAESTNTHR